MSAPPSGSSLVVALSFLTLLLPHGLDAQNMNSEERIRALRAGSNAALEAHDVEGFMATIDEDYTGTAGNGGHIRSREALRSLIAALDSNDGPYVWFVRTTETIEVDPAGGRAMEMGRWVQHTRQDGVTQSGIGGGYTAYWRRAGGRWLIHGELFVTLEGSSDFR